MGWDLENPRGLYNPGLPSNCSDFLKEFVNFFLKTIEMVKGIAINKEKSEEKGGGGAGSGRGETHHADALGLVEYY